MHLFRTRATKDRLIVAAMELGCSPTEAAIVAKHARIQRHDRGEFLARIGGIDDTIHIIVNGSATATPSDGERIHINKGGVVGELFAYRVAMFQLADVVCDEVTETISFTHATYREIRDRLPMISSIVEAAKAERQAIVEAKRQAERVARWNRYQELKQYIQ